MDIEAICALPVASITAERSMLFLWVPPSFLHKGLRVVGAWGFEFLTSMVWDKERDGMGYYARQRHEHLLLAHHGDPLVPAPSTLSSSIIAAPRKKHSEKPVEFRQAIQRMYPGLPKIELFRREACAGWAGWGNQILAA
jgi:N6-adenosine-specific RNA methylase IME4